LFSRIEEEGGEKEREQKSPSTVVGQAKRIHSCTFCVFYWKSFRLESNNTVDSFLRRF
jgi:hypothetical protein